MRAIANLIAFVVIACSSGSAGPSVENAARLASPDSEMLRVFRGQQKLTIEMRPDDHILDGAGLTVGSFDAASRVVTVGDLQLPLDEIVRGRKDRSVTLELPIGAWTIDVAISGDVTINGEPWGRVEGFSATPQAWRRLEALFAALPVIPTPAPPRTQSP